jgi:tetratricopeptide (TPR) repeat protein
MTSEQAGYDIIGRDAELKELRLCFDRAIEGAGSTVLISGEPGIGKTRLVEEFKKHAAKKDARMLAGGASSESMHPFLVFSRALEGISQEPLFEEQEYTSFTEIFAVNSAGLLLAKASSEIEAMDADIFAGMLSAVQDFVRDSLDRTGEKKAGLGRLEYGDMTVFIEHGQHIFLTAVFRGAEHQDMKNLLKQAIHKIEQKHGAMLEKWSGKISDTEPVKEEINALAGVKFLVRRNLEGVKLDTERLRIADKLLAFLLELSKEEPLLLLLEDLHWADDSSLFVFNYLARNMKGKPAMLLATCRPGESQNLQKTLDAMKKEEVITEMALKKLGKESVTGIINSVYPGNDFPKEFIDSLAERCGGTPLFVLEFLRQMASDGSVSQVLGKYTLVNQNYTIPDSIEGVIQNRLAGLDSNALAMAEFASCIGREFSVDSTLAIKTITEPSLALAELQRSGVVYRHNGSAEFSHAMYQDVIYSSIAPRWKSAHHKVIGEYYEGVYQGKLGEVYYELARHFSQTTEYEKTSTYCVLAAEKAESSYALELARDFYEKVLTALPRMRGRGEITERRADILERLSNICAVLGEYDLAIKYLDEVLPQKTGGLARANVLRQYGYIYNRKGAIDESIARMEEALSALGNESRTDYGKICTTQGNNWYYKGDVEKALAYTDQAIRIFERDEPDEKELADALRVKALILSHMGKHLEAIEMYSRSLDIWTRFNDERRMAAMLGNIGNVYAEKGEFQKSLEYYEKGLVLLRKIRHKHNIAVMSVNMGATYYALGDMDRALAYFKESADAFAKIGDPFGLSTAYMNTGVIHIQFGEYDEALVALGKALAIAEKDQIKMTMANTLEAMGSVFCEQRDYEKSKEYFERSMEIARASANSSHIVSAHTSLAELYCEKGDDQEARRFATEALRLAEENGLAREGAFATRALGRVYETNGETSKAIEMYEKARTTFEDMGEPSEIAITDYRFGSVHVKMGEADKARKHLEKALETFQECKQTVWASKTRSMLDSL